MANYHWGHRFHGDDCELGSSLLHSYASKLCCSWERESERERDRERTRTLSFFFFRITIEYVRQTASFWLKEDHGAYDYQWKKRRLDFGASQLWPPDIDASWPWMAEGSETPHPEIDPRCRMLPQLRNLLFRRGTWMLFKEFCTSQTTFAFPMCSTSIPFQICWRGLKGELGTSSP